MSMRSSGASVCTHMRKTTIALAHMMESVAKTCQSHDIRCCHVRLIDRCTHVSGSQPGVAVDRFGDIVTDEVGDCVRQRAQLAQRVYLETLVRRSLIGTSDRHTQAVVGDFFGPA